MSDELDRRSHSRSPQQRAVVLRRLLRAFLIVDLLVLVAAASIWMAVRTGDDAGRTNAVNQGLTGSLPPADTMLPKLERVAGITPPVVAVERLNADAVLLVGTCMQCRSGDVIGGFLGRSLAEDTLGDGARVVVVAWDGDPHAWRAQWRIPDDITIHTARTARSREHARAALGIGESGIAFVADGHGRWRSTFHLGQLNADDIRHDLDVVARQ